VLTLLVLPVNNPRPGVNDKDAPLACSKPRSVRWEPMILPVALLGAGIGVVVDGMDTVAAGGTVGVTIGVTIGMSGVSRRNTQGDGGGDSIA